MVIRGLFAGQDLLGIIECKDLSRKVDTPILDAFVTKAQEVNANFKILVSRKGFTRKAIEKAAHYGIQTLSLIAMDENESADIPRVATKWHADIYRWNRITVKLHLEVDPPEPLDFKADEVMIGGRPVLPWFTNYLLSYHENEKEEGWVGVRVDFEEVQVVTAGSAGDHRCVGITFHAERMRDKKEKVVNWQGEGFYDWQSGKIKLAPNSQLATAPVQADFHAWPNRFTDDIEGNGFLHVKIVGAMAQLKWEDDVLPLDEL